MIPAVDRSFRILDLLSRSPAPLGASEVARRLGLPKSTAHGLLRSLREVGAVEDVSRRYRLGPAVEHLAAIAELRRRWRPALQELAAASAETAFLGQVRGARVAIVDEVLGSGGPVVSAPVGTFVPASAGALARVLTGARVAREQGEYLAGVNAVAAAVPGGLLWVAGFAGRLDAAMQDRVEAMLERLV
ncbi:MAG: helix-turn-helix domain-containing protein [Actinomycetota bacterium]|nr:helix-turn-helix domain-containing protein [Candidatus Dormibacteraeota bacterium]MDQ6915986.1 helix-turn-helix domain-containing protein [Actinomycetota bacterium]